MEDLIIEYYNMAIYGEYGNVTINISNNVTIWFTRITGVFLSREMLRNQWI